MVTLAEPQYVAIGIADFEHPHLDPVDVFDVAGSASPAAQFCLSRLDVIGLEKEDCRSRRSRFCERPVPCRITSISKSDSNGPHDCFRVVFVLRYLASQHIAIESDASVQICDRYKSHCGT